MCGARVSVCCQVGQSLPDRVSARGIIVARDGAYAGRLRERRGHAGRRTKHFVGDGLGEGCSEHDTSRTWEGDFGRGSHAVAGWHRAAGGDVADTSNHA